MQFDPGKNANFNEIKIPNQRQISPKEAKNKDKIVADDKGGVPPLAKEHLQMPPEHARPSKIDVEKAIQIPINAYEQIKPFYHASMDREKAEGFLKGKEDGNFLIRPSSAGKDHLVISILKGTKIDHILVKVKPNGAFVIRDKESSSLNSAFINLNIKQSKGIAPSESQPHTPEAKAHQVFHQSPLSPAPAPGKNLPLVMPPQFRQRELPEAPPVFRSFTPKIGEQFELEQLESRADIKAPKNFEVGETVIVARSSGKFEYVVITQIKNDEIFFSDASGPIGSKNIQGFYKAKHIDENKKPVTDEKLSPEELFFEQFQAEDLGAEGLRTRAGKQFVRNLKCCSNDGSIIRAGSKEYVTVSGNAQGFSSMRFASCGSSTREVILLDPKNSPALEAKYEILRQQLDTLARSQNVPLAPEQVLKHIMTFVRVNVFPSCRDHDLVENTDKLVNKARVDKKHELTENRDNPGLPIPLMPIDDFINAGLGVCRHHALVTAYLMDRLTKEPVGKPYLEGTIQHMRDNVPGGAHVWTTFIPRANPNQLPQKWHLDTLWGTVENFATPEGFASLKRSYGDAIDRQQNRTMGAAQINGQPVGVIHRPPPPVPKVSTPQIKPQVKPQPLGNVAAPVKPTPIKEVKSGEQLKLEKEFVDKLIKDLKSNQAKCFILNENFFEVNYGEEGSLNKPQNSYKFRFSPNGMSIHLLLNSGPLNAVRSSSIKISEKIAVKNIEIEGEYAKQIQQQLKQNAKEIE